ncbi:hypothetical protein [Mycolicibacterium sp. CR10]|uniref:hypothetical protein n=1 Tax=Mycolicibacterium sp. CR10 TaxID=2562314 RepID=UPI0010C008BA|nr:hypothetical protein [Mycolicibacterium sp. CR10]
MNTDEERLADLYLQAMRAANDHFFHGTLSAEAFQLVMARITLNAQGVDNPTYEQCADRVKELAVGYSFLSPAPK